MEDSRAPLDKPIISQIPKPKSQKRTAERARAKENFEPKYKKPPSWAEFQLTQELKTQENGELFLQYDSGSTKVQHKSKLSTVQMNGVRLSYIKQRHFQCYTLWKLQITYFCHSDFS